MNIEHNTIGETISRGFEKVAAIQNTRKALFEAIFKALTTRMQVMEMLHLDELEFLDKLATTKFDLEIGEVAAATAVRAEDQDAEVPEIQFIAIGAEHGTAALVLGNTTVTFLQAGVKTSQFLNKDVPRKVIIHPDNAGTELMELFKLCKVDVFDLAGNLMQPGVVPEPVHVEEAAAIITTVELQKPVEEDITAGGNVVVNPTLAEHVGVKVPGAPNALAAAVSSAVQAPVQVALPATVVNADKHPELAAGAEALAQQGKAVVIRGGKVHTGGKHGKH